MLKYLLRIAQTLPSSRIFTILLTIATLGIRSAQAQIIDPTQIPASLPLLLQQSGNQLPARVQGSTNDTKVSRQVVEDPLQKAQMDSIKRVQAAEAKANRELSEFRRKIFGYSIFNNKSLQWEPNYKIATPKNYILGPDDQLIIIISGYSAFQYTRTVTPDGFVSFDNMVGNVYVSGLTIEQATERLKDRLSRIYMGLSGSSPNTFISVTLGNIRTIRVTVLGDVINPGTYPIPSLATVMTALTQAGGPSEMGSFRNIELIRQNKVVTTLDLYDIITTGGSKNDIRLLDQDVIRVPTYKTRVELAGRVKKPGYYEALPAEHLNKIIEFAGGFAQDAYSARLKVYRTTDRERQILDVTNSQFGAFELKDGDLIRIDTVLTRYQNLVKVTGAVYRPGEFSLDQNQTLLTLIKNADGLRDDAFTSRINLIRLQPDLMLENVSVNLADIINGKTEDIKLKREDEVVIRSKFDIRQEQLVRIQGAVNLKRSETGYFPYRENMTVEDLILLSGGLQESAFPQRIEVARRKRNTTDTERSNEIAELFEFGINKDLKLSAEASKFILQPFDQVIVRTAPNYEEQQYVTIEGQVKYPGLYPLKNRTERISDIIKRSGGISTEGYLAGAQLVRKVKLTKAEIAERNKSVAEISDDTKDAAIQAEAVDQEKEETVGIDFTEALNNPGSVEDVILQDGDIIRVPKQLSTVRINGEVLYPTSTRYQGGFLKDYISAAGGFTSRSIRSRVFVRYANGTLDRTRKFLVFNNYPKIQPGAEIFVPVRTKADTTPQQVLSTLQGLLVSLTSITSLIIGFSILKK
ncbi:MAG: SLBB domain-containing protein [Spirosomataceae bacterium]